MITATITRGRKTNRVKVKRKSEHSPQRALANYRKDPSTRGMDCVVISISLPVGDLADIDNACERLRMARSHLLRQAAREFAKRNL